MPWRAMTAINILYVPIPAVASPPASPIIAIRGLVSSLSSSQRPPNTPPSKQRATNHPIPSNLSTVPIQPTRNGPSPIVCAFYHNRNSRVNEQPLPDRCSDGQSPLREQRPASTTSSREVPDEGPGTGSARPCQETMPLHHHVRPSRGHSDSKHLRVVQGARHLVQPAELLGIQLPAEGSEIVVQLLDGVAAGYRHGNFRM